MVPQQIQICPGIGSHSQRHIVTDIRPGSPILRIDIPVVHIEYLYVRTPLECTLHAIALMCIEIDHQDFIVW